MDENVDFRSSQQPTAGSEETLKQSSTDERETGPITPRKVLKRTLSIDEQAEAINSPKKKVLVEISQCLLEESNLFSTKIMNESNLEKSITTCNINETEFKPEENGDFRSSQQLTAGSEETPKQSSTDDKETGPITPTKILKRTLSIDEQAEDKNSSQKKVLSDSSAKVLVDTSQCLLLVSNLSSTEIMDHQYNLERYLTSCNINETEFKPEEKKDCSVTTAIKTEFGENAQTRENSINDTNEDQTLKSNSAQADQKYFKKQKKDSPDLIGEILQTNENFIATKESQYKLNMALRHDSLIDIDPFNQNIVQTDRSKTKVNQNILPELSIEISPNGENSSETDADNAQKKMSYSEPSQKLSETSQENLNLQIQDKSELLNFPSERLKTKKDSSILCHGKEMLKATDNSGLPSACQDKQDNDPNHGKSPTEKKVSFNKTVLIKRLSSNEISTEPLKEMNLSDSPQTSPQTSPQSQPHNFASTLEEEACNKLASKIFPNENPESLHYGLILISLRNPRISDRNSSEPTPSASRDKSCELSCESEDLKSRELKDSSESKDSQRKFSSQTPSSEFTESTGIGANSCGLNKSMKSQDILILEQSHLVKQPTTFESSETESSLTSVSELDEQEISEENIESGNAALQNPSPTENSSEQPELQAKAGKDSPEPASDESSSGSGTFNPDLGALIDEVITEIELETCNIDTQAENWRNRDPSLEIRVPEDAQESNHQSIMEQLSRQLERFLLIVNRANNSIESILDNMRALRPHFNVLGLIEDMENAVLHHSDELEVFTQIILNMGTTWEVNSPYELYYKDFSKSILIVHNALQGIREQLQLISENYFN